VVKQKFRDQIHHDVMHGLIPRAVEEALQERGIEPVDTPDIKDVALREGDPLKFTAAIETVPPFDPGDLSSISLRREASTVDQEAIDKTMERLRERAAKYETVEGRSAEQGDTLILDLERTDARGATDRHESISLEIGAPANPPGFDANLVGLNPGDRKTFVIHFPADYAVTELADTDVTYSVTVKEIRQRQLPALNDEFAKDLGEFESLEGLRGRVLADLEDEAQARSNRQLRNELLTQLAARVTFDLPDTLVERELDRRLEEFARRLIDQRIDPRKAGIDWAQFREAQREPARSAVGSALVLDEIARRENLTVPPEDVDKEIERFATASGRTPAAVRAQLEKEGGIARLYAGLRRERAVDLAMSRVKITDESRQTIGDS
jgi:trigger factor